MTIDIELDAWRREWSSGTGTLPDPRRRIRRQNLRKMLALALLAVCLAFSTVMAVREPGSFWKGFAAGIWSTALVVGGYAWRVHRGAWRPSAQTTQAYFALCLARAQAQARTRRFAFGFLLIATAFYLGHLALGQGRIGTPQWIVAGALMLEVALFIVLRRRDQRALDEARRLMEVTRSASDESPASAE
jgi:hypothetical protein